MPASLVPAAGGVVWRGERDKVEVAIVHRPRYDDWSLPKGKVRRGEQPLHAAVREVGEELTAVVGAAHHLRQVRYRVGNAYKTVAFWGMRYLAGDFVSGDEVDTVEWCSAADALERLTYDTDRTVLSSFTARPVPDAVIVLVRHARAGSRSQWHGDDALRPLDEIGVRQAEALVDFLGCFVPDRLVSADPLRCTQTLEPFARSSGLPLEVDPVFADEAWEDSAAGVLSAVQAAAVPGHATVICSQGLTIPALVEQVGVGVTDSTTRKAAAWVLSFAEGRVVACDYYDRTATLA